MATKLMDFREMQRRLEALPAPTLTKAFAAVRDGFGAKGLAIECGLSIKEANAVFAYADYATRSAAVQVWVNSYTKFSRHQLWTAIDGDGRELQLHWDRDLRKLELVVAVHADVRRVSRERRVPLKQGSSEWAFWDRWAHRFLPT